MAAASGTHSFLANEFRVTNVGPIGISHLLRKEF